MQAVQLIEDRQYKKALSILEEGFYDKDYNTAVCLMSLGYDGRALEIMLGHPGQKLPSVNPLQPPGA